MPDDHIKSKTTSYRAYFKSNGLVIARLGVLPDITVFELV